MVVFSIFYKYNKMNVIVVFYISYKYNWINVIVESYGISLLSLKDHALHMSRTKKTKTKSSQTSSVGNYLMTGAGKQPPEESVKSQEEARFKVGNSNS